MGYYQSNYVRRRYTKKRGRRWLLVFVVLLIAGSVLGKLSYDIVLKPNVWISGEDSRNDEIFIPSEYSYEQLVNTLYEQGLIIHRNNFEYWAEWKKLPEHFKSGHYRLKSDMSNNSLINMLLAGNQAPVKVVINKERLPQGMAGRLSRQLEVDSAAILNLLTDSVFLSKYGLNTENVMVIFVPNTYEMYWNISAEKLINKVVSEYNSFWNETRKAKAISMGMSISEIVTLASIVEEETNKNDEKSRVAGVYINRLKSGWLLQADPTLKFAIGDFTIKRVLNEHKKVDSPYNTYKFTGLPPGPICSPSISSIDAVLNFEDHNFMFFCAKEDFSGYHNFARTSSQHIANARKYQQALNKRRIFK